MRSRRMIAVIVATAALSGGCSGPGRGPVETLPAVPLEGSTTTPAKAAARAPLITPRCPADGPARCPKAAPSSILPDAATPPEATVNLYLAALNAHNTALAEQLLEPSWRTKVEQAPDSWLTNIVSITDVHITAVTTLPVHPGAPSSPQAEIPPGYSQGIIVGTTFVLHQQRRMSMLDGETIRNFTLVRRDSSSRWLIAAEGVA